jgi:hypothetical protein
MLFFFIVHINSYGAGVERTIAFELHFEIKWNFVRILPYMGLIQLLYHKICRATWSVYKKNYQKKDFLHIFFRFSIQIWNLIKQYSHMAKLFY